MKLLNREVVKITLFFIGGILTGYWLNLPLNYTAAMAGIVFFVFLFAYVRSKKLFIQDFFFGSITFLMVFVLGMLTVQVHSPKNKPQHYTNLLSSDMGKTEEIWLVGNITKILNPSQYSLKYILNLQEMKDFPAHGKVLLNLQKGSTGNTLNIDDKIVLKAPLKLINLPKNPHQFNYRAFMENREVYRSIHTNFPELLVFEPQKTSLLGYAEKLRNQIVFSLQKNGLSHKQLAMVQGLLLGQTQDISEETYDNYIAAGVIHILSVSGLHVGFVLLVLNFVLKPLERLKWGKPIKMGLLILLLWSFALLAGFSSPVVRSVTMFSFVAIGLNMNRETNVLNALFMSLLVILLFAPRFVFEVGFQLSYLAVFSIVVFQPKIYGLYKPRSWIDKAIWGTFTVSLAAQFGVVPLSLFYFHQFPGIFFISNLVVIPFVGLIMAYSLFAIALAMLGGLPAIMATLLGESLNWLNIFVAWCARQEAFLFRNIQFSEWHLLSSYLLVFCIFLGLWYFSYKKLMACLVATVVLFGVFIFEKWKTANASNFVVFHESRNTILGFKNGTQLALKHNLETQDLSEEYAVKAFITGEAIAQVSSASLQNIYKINQEFLLVVDSLGIYQLPKLQSCTVLLRDSPKINLNRLIDQLHPKMVISDGSNYTSFVNRWRKTCALKNIPFYYTGEKGAFVWEF